MAEKLESGHWRRLRGRADANGAPIAREFAVDQNMAGAFIHIRDVMGIGSNP
jgi:hypothetical protein